ncbi:MAG: class I SAM-dependent methyltransferase [Eubacteriales bacterium]|nr:class I SAM-dependent methyltransferase [Eubacteriales bacterium]
MNDRLRDSIKRTKQGFEESFQTGEFYNKQTQDETHLKRILDFLPVREGMKILDLGTGTGYLAFPLAEQYERAEIVGLDIVEEALKENRVKAAEKGLENLEFVSYDGIGFPFEDNSFDMIVTRYALHHFPAIGDTFKEAQRVLRSGGNFFISDPAPNDNDEQRFVDAYMQMKRDGHICFYTKAQWEEIGKETGFVYSDGFETNIRFPKKKESAPELESILNRFDDEVIKGYDLEITDDEIWITERVNNLLFVKEK